ncbi:MAG: biotin--[acetyl-CoA-carboxylase] ligase [Aureisphaera sp.]
MNIIKLNAIGSTNDYLKGLSKETHLEDGTVVLTEDQTKGRGQMGSSWQFERGKSLAFSVFKRFDGILVDHQFAITVQVSLTLLNCLEQFGIPNLTVKWPNDIMAGDKKLCGILVENQLMGNQIKGSVVGIGLNVMNSSFVGLPNATSMSLIAGNSFDVEEVFSTIAEEIVFDLNHFYADHFHLFKMYEESLYRKGQVSVFSDGNEPFNGIIRGVDGNGELRLEIEDGTVKTYRLKKIKLLN